METLKDLKQKSLIAIAESLGIPFKRISSDIYEHPEHDSFKVFMRTNTFKWFSRDQGGDAIDFVQTLTGVGFKEAVSYLKTGNFQLHKEELVKKEPFRYYVTEDGQEKRIFI
ncbi:TPA: hypothetical protein VBA85_002084 [Streptococcus agalactiae]|nr:hypothetical protein [Streptococcus agalactiae]